MADHFFEEISENFRPGYAGEETPTVERIGAYELIGSYQETALGIRTYMLNGPYNEIVAKIDCRDKKHPIILLQRDCAIRTLSTSSVLQIGDCATIVRRVQNKTEIQTANIDYTKRQHSEKILEEVLA